MNLNLGLGESAKKVEIKCIDFPDEKYKAHFLLNQNTEELFEVPAPSK
jgi:hypothetical protein